MNKLLCAKCHEQKRGKRIKKKIGRIFYCYDCIKKYNEATND